MRRNTNLRPDTLALLQRMITSVHPYAQLYLHANEILTSHSALDNVPDLAVRICFDPTRHNRRRDNLPSADEVAVILPGDGSQPTGPRDIILRARGGHLQRISDTHPAYTPLHYVLLFPYGEDGWHPDLQMTRAATRPGLNEIADSDYTSTDEEDEEGNGHGSRRHRSGAKRLTQTLYYGFQLQVRDDQYSTLLRGGRLLQQYIVDAWASAEQNRLRFIQYHQPTLRASLYSGLQDAVAHADAAMDLNELGQRVVLPSSFRGGPRYMHQLLQDSLAIGREYRKIDIFLTMTCNPNWPEIQRELLPGQQASDRPDLVARVFQMKKEALLEDVFKKYVLGHTSAFLYTIEFQKRGLPHMHLLIFLADEHKLRTPDDIDSCIRATWPDPETEPLLFDTVKRCMVHGPCGAANSHAPCMENGHCTKGYPKPFSDSTTLDEDGYPRYYRPNDGRAYQVGNHMVDNRWIVAYCPFLSSKYDCHINVECAVSFASIKYLHKYIFKGYDRATLEINQLDEVKLYLESRYISAIESTCRIHHLHLHGRSPSVVRLQVHLPGQHMVVFDPNESVEDIMSRAAHESTTLTAFFKANADPVLGPMARQYTYCEFPKHFTWKASAKKWQPRRRGSAIGRMYFVPPTAGERFYLRTILTVARGPHSWDDLLTVNNIRYSTFHEVCLARGLLADDGEWRLCLLEAGEMQTGFRLRQLFATLLLFCNPSNPHALWLEFRHNICDDLGPQLLALGRDSGVDSEVRYDYGLYLLEDLLRKAGHTLSDFHMPTPSGDWQSCTLNRLIAEQTAYDPEHEQAVARERVSQLNSEQADAFHQIVNAVQEQSGQLFFLNGPGGTGKTFVYNTVCHHLRGQRLIVLCVASSGIASLLLLGGRTAHSMFKIPIEGLNGDSTCTISKQSQLAGT